MQSTHPRMPARLPFTLDQKAKATFLAMLMRERMRHMVTEMKDRGSSKDDNSHDTSMLFDQMDVKDNHRLPPSLINVPCEYLSDREMHSLFPLCVPSIKISISPIPRTPR